jgi:hypothetical protein
VSLQQRAATIKSLGDIYFLNQAAAAVKSWGGAAAIDTFFGK